MSLIKSFNKNFFFQNIKKSKSLLAVLLGLFPVFNLIVLMMMDRETSVFDLASVSIINILGLYIIPVILSISLFKYVFSKRSVDFTGSMPISKKSIFITNWIGGSLILFFIILLNTIALSIFSLLLPYSLPLGFYIDYIILWSISYIFAFAAANVAVSISGTVMTSLAVWMLILFFVPFIDFYINNGLDNYYLSNSQIECLNEDCKPEYYQCESDLCKENLEKSIYRLGGVRIINENNYSQPARMMFNGSNQDIYNIQSIIRMILLTIVYFILGLILFKKRKMEDCEISFKNFHIHTIIKCLTGLPVLLIMLLLFGEIQGLASMFLVITIFLGYFLIYDIFTKRGIRKIGLSSLYFGAIYLIAFGICHYRYNVINNTLYPASDITSVKILYESKYNSSLSHILIEDNQLINYLVKNAIEKRNNSYLSDYAYDYDYYISVGLMVNNKLIEFELSLLENEYNYIIEYFQKSPEYERNINFDNIFAAQIGENILSRSEISALIDTLKSINSETTFNAIHGTSGVLSGATYNYDFYETNFIYYIYNNHQLERYSVPINVNAELKRFVIDYANTKIRNITPSSVNFVYQSPLENSYDVSLNNFIISLEMKNFIDFILEESSKDFDIDQPYIMFQFGTNQGKYYRAYINNIDKYRTLIDNYLVKHENHPNIETYKDDQGR